MRLRNAIRPTEGEVMHRTEMVGLGIVGAAAALAATRTLTRTSDASRRHHRPPVSRAAVPPHLLAARALNRSSALLALSVLADSWMEHYRGSFENRAMYTPLVVSLLALGAAAERLRDEPAHEPRLCGMPAGRALALLASVGLVGTVGEVALLHFRGAFHNPAMYAPVAIPPVAAALLANAAFAPSQPDRWFTRLWLRCTAVLGFAGVGFHLFGVARNMGGWRNWSQNIFSGPPLPAPPSFTALALAGLAALGLREGESDD
jgi:hypothetical protein